MNKLAPIIGKTPDPVRAMAAFTEDCSDCEGTGFFYCGERAWDCESCSGTGEVEVEPTCQCGETADATGFCSACDDVAETGWLRAETSALFMGVKL